MVEKHERNADSKNCRAVVALSAAGPLGIEPRSALLERDILPLNYGPVFL